MEEDSSDNESTNYSIIESSQSSSFSFTGKLPESRTQYKKDKVCIICKTQFGIGIINKRHFCKFCYRGVCTRCSPSVAFHPEERKMLRICDFCCENTVKNQFSEVFQTKIEKLKEQKVFLENEFKELSQEIQEILKENYKLETLLEIEKVTQESILAKFTNNDALQAKHSKIQVELDELLNKSQGLQSVISEKDLEIAQLTLQKQNGSR